MNMETDTGQNALNLTPDYTVDARNQPCPMPILMLKRLLKTIDKNLSSSENSNSKIMILIKATDPNSQQDLAHFCQIQQLKIVQQMIVDDEFHYYIEK
ncbi:sulfurtransferase TusA family protein [Acinetobacter sp. A3.8]|uniref:Sulfurtransferase TusA family protein n=1 Tax=Acinetobacter sedimenti TaxID=2919922 RepID=A0A9X1WXP9_9GAMM|nr:sulfurtransferase TusA family protein [Acinetobacter sedimenti]MCJ8146428.1 sulfurtransferase TusA family protein [Acinetobacter sedimenti]